VSHLGNGTYSLDFTIAPTGLTTFTVAGTQTLVAANGDQLFATFADATGTMTSVVVSEVLTIAGGFATDSQEGTITGTISN
jgi:hypothetical protein